jgi:hypothetical protein
MYKELAMNADKMTELYKETAESTEKMSKYWLNTRYTSTSFYRTTSLNTI